MQGVNTQSCEQLNALLKRFKGMVRVMGRLTSAFFLIEMAHVHNQQWMAA